MTTLSTLNFTAGQKPTADEWEAFFNDIINVLNSVPADNLAKTGGKVAISITGDAATVGGLTTAEIVAGDFPEVLETLGDLLCLNGDGGLVLDGGAASANGTTANQLDITAIKALVLNGDAITRVEIAATTETTALALTTYYLDLEDGASAYTWGTSHPSGDYIPIAAVLTDGSGNIDTVTDTRPLTAALFEGYDCSITATVTDGAITTAKLGADAVTGAKIADNAIDSEHYVDGSIDREHLAADIVNGTKIADDSVDSEHIAAGAIDSEHFAAGAVDTTALATSALTADATGRAKMADGFVTAAKTDAVSTGTASKLVVRDANGRAQFADPSADADAATKNYVDDKTRTRTAVLTAAGSIPASTNGAAKSIVTGTNHEYYVCAFDKDTDEAIYFDFVVPADYQAGNITVKVYWIAPSATSGAVVWNYATLGVGSAEGVDGTLGTVQTKTATTAGVAKQLNVTSFDAANPGWAAGDLAIVKISRDANNGSDSLAEDAQFISAEIQYTGQ